MALYTARQPNRMVMQQQRGQDWPTISATCSPREERSACWLRPYGLLRLNLAITERTRDA
jgi:hypothetical protein